MRPDQHRRGLYEFENRAWGTASPARVRRGTERLLIYLLVFFVFWLFTLPVSFGQSPARAEYDIKAVFLYTFAKFVEWPSNSLPNDKSPIVLCVIGADPFGMSLDDTVRGQRIEQHEIVVRRVSRTDDLRSCHIAFISRAENKFLPEILANLKGCSTLVVGDAQGFVERGGAIQMYLDDNSVRFAINPDVLKRAHLEMSSAVLTLATIVHDKSQQGAE